MKRPFIKLTLAILLFLPAIALAEKIVFATAIWPPYMMMKNEQLSGLDTEIVKEVCKRLKIEAEFQVLPWKRAVMYVKKGRVDAIFALRHTQERAKFVFYPSEPILMERTVILARKGSSITKLDDLKDNIIGIVRGYAYSPEFDKQQGLKRMVCDSDELMIKMVGKKRIDLAADCSDC